METSQLLLKAGDILLYRPCKFQWKSWWTWPFGQLIAVKTWHHISHVELYDGNKNSLASRDGKGVARYPTRLSELTYVLRPTVALNLDAGRKWFETELGTPYGWLDLLNFIGLPVDKRGVVCSPFVVGFLRASGWNVFPADKDICIAPFQFLDLVGRECEIAYGPLA